MAFIYERRHPNPNPLNRLDLIDPGWRWDVKRQQTNTSYRRYSLHALLLLFSSKDVMNFPQIHEYTLTHAHVPIRIVRLA